MQHFLAVLLVFAVLSSATDSLKPFRDGDNDRQTTRDSEDGRLPRTLLPYHYDLDITPDFYRPAPPFPFTGVVSISFECVQTTDVLTVNSLGLTISSASVVVSPDSGISPPTPTVIDWTLEDAVDFLHISVLNAFQPGANYVVTIEFNGIVNNFEDGLYYDSYVSSADGSTKYILATQMESIGARRTFPCFDEPDLKATFNVTVAHSPTVTALSNMPVIDTIQRPNGWVANVYDQSPIMSTYQVCICIGELEYIEVNWQGVVNYPVRVYARPDIIDQMQYTANITARIQAWLESETGILYRLPKMDHIALPTKGGAMENWGLITYGEQTIAYNPETSSASGVQYIGVINSHELAHQWFGNLVTAKWWNDIWLNEGFANHYDFPPTQSIGWPRSDPTLRDTQDFMNADQKNTSDPVVKKIDTPQQADSAFSGSTYPKGSAMVTFLRGILTPGVFRAAITRYLNTYSYSSATSDNLWQILADQASADGFPLDVKTIMDPWLNQMGFPVVSVIRGANGTATVTQKLFQNPPNQEMTVESPWNYRWTVPLTVVTSSSSPADWDGRPTDWFNIDETELILSGLPSSLSDWIMVNPNGKFYYRVLYDDSNHAAIVAQLLSDHTVIDNQTISQFIDDSFNLARASYIPETAAMETTRYLGNERTFNPWFAALKYTSLSNSMLSSLSLIDSFALYMLNLITPAYTDLGWSYSPDENPDEQMLRRDIIAAACDYGSADCREQARIEYSRYSIDPSVNRVDPNNLPTVLCTGVSEGTSSDWFLVYEQYQQRKTSQIRNERYAYLIGMSCTTDPLLIDAYLTYIVRGVEIPTRDQYRASLYLSQNPLGADRLWSYFDNSWMTAPSGMNKFTILRRITETFATQEDLDRLNALISKYPPQSESQRSQFNQMTLTVKQNIVWLADNQNSLRDWLIANGPTTSIASRVSVQPRLPVSVANQWRSMNIREDDIQRW